MTRQAAPIFFFLLVIWLNESGGMADVYFSKALPTVSEETRAKGVQEKCIAIGSEHEHPQKGNQKAERKENSALVNTT
jgi:hypothetical protein